MGHLRRLRKHSAKLRRSKGRRSDQSNPERIELEMGELEAILERIRPSLSPEEYTKLHAALETLVFVTQELEKKQVSVQRLKQLLFGATTETTRKVMERILDEAGKEGKSADSSGQTEETEPRQKAKGHGRNGAEEYVGAEKVRVPHESLRAGDACPNCQMGTDYESV